MLNEFNNKLVGERIGIIIEKAKDKDSNPKKLKKYTHEAISEELDVSRETVSNWLRNDRIPDTQNIYNLSLLFDCDADYILGLSNTPRKADATVSEDTGLSKEAIAILRNIATQNNQKIVYEGCSSEQFEKEDPNIVVSYKNVLDSFIRHFLFNEIIRKICVIVSLRQESKHYAELLSSSPDENDRLHFENMYINNEDLIEQYLWRLSSNMSTIANDIATQLTEKNR